MSPMTVTRTTEAARRVGLPAHLTFVLVVAALLAVVVLAAHGAAEVYEAVAAGDGIEALDLPVLDAAVASRTPALTEAAVTLTDLAGRVGTPLLGVLALAVFTWRRRDWAPALVLVTGLVGSLLLTVAGKRITDRVRPPREFMLPPYETSPSFPSGHTLNTTVLAVLVAYLVVVTVRHAFARWAAIAVCAADPLATGASRIYLGAHWCTDVLAGLLVGAAWAFAVVLAHRVWLQLRRSENGPASTPETAAQVDAPARRRLRR